MGSDGSRKAGGNLFLSNQDFAGVSMGFSPGAGGGDGAKGAGIPLASRRRG
jgi:hypothetical protein